LLLGLARDSLGIGAVERRDWLVGSLAREHHGKGISVRSSKFQGCCEDRAILRDAVRDVALEKK
jgi:hypothetical protein